MSIKSIQHGQAVLKPWMDSKTDKPKCLIADEADEGGETTVQRLITPIMDMPKMLVILTSNANGPKLPYHPRFNDRVSAHVPFTMNDQLREEIMSRQILNLEEKFDLKCSWASRTTILGIAQDKGIRTAINQLEVSAYRSNKDGHKNLFIYSNIFE